MRRIRTWHVIIKGFTQAHDAQDGSDRLWLRLFNYNSPTTYVGLRTWDNDFSELASKMRRTSDFEQGDPAVFVYAYSWGAGNGFVNLARELAKRGMRINAAVLADPVYHSRCPVPFVRWIARGIGVARRGTITIPNAEHVGRVHVLRQEIDWPRGSDLARDDGSTEGIIDHPILDVGHNAVDDHSVYQLTAMVEASRHHRQLTAVGHGFISEREAYETLGPDEAPF